MSDEAGCSMKDEYKQKAYDYEKDEAVYRERQRRKRIARRKRQQRQRRNRRLMLCTLLLLVVVLVVVLCPKETSTLKGTWAYGEMATIQFSGRNSGMITLSDTEYPFTYTVEENALQLSFGNAYIADAVYTFTVEDDTLILSGGDGTTGGTYTLTKIKK